MTFMLRQRWLGYQKNQRKQHCRSTKLHHHPWKMVNTDYERQVLGSLLLCLGLAVLGFHFAALAVLLRIMLGFSVVLRIMLPSELA